MKSSSIHCPVPAEQQPINEYEDIRLSWFYSWGTRNLAGFIKPLILLWLLSWLITGPVAAVSFAPERALGSFLISAGLGAMVVPALSLLQLYVGWSHVGHRLQQSTIPYEESGWYDGQIWTKPEDILKRDRLLVDYQVKPVIRRIRKTFGVMAGTVLAAGLTWQFV